MWILWHVQYNSSADIHWGKIAQWASSVVDDRPFDEWSLHFHLLWAHPFTSSEACVDKHGQLFYIKF